MILARQRPPGRRLRAAVMRVVTLPTRIVLGLPHVPLGDSWSLTSSAAGPASTSPS